MDHCLAVYIYQAPSDILELWESRDHRQRARLAIGLGPYELKPIHVLVLLDKLVYVPINHPLRYHREMAVVHYRPQQR